MTEPENEKETGPQTMLFEIPIPEGNSLVGWGTLVVLIYTALTMGTGGISEQTVREVIRGTGRISMLVFLLAYIRIPCSTLPAESPGGWAARNYSKLLLLLASSHTIHAAAIAALVYLYAPSFDTVSLAVGGLGYFLLYVLAALALGGMLANTAGEEGAIEAIASHYVWFVFVATTGSAIVSNPETVLFTALGLVAAYYRYSATKGARH